MVYPPLLSAYPSSAALDLTELYQPPPPPTTHHPPMGSAFMDPAVALMPTFPHPVSMDPQKVSLSKLGGGGGMVGGGGNIPAGTTHIVTDKGGHTIYDSELKLLLDSRKASSQGRKFIEDFTTYKHGSFLLFGQRGLLETLPLTYTCLAVTGNAAVIEPNIHTLPHVPDTQTSQAGAHHVSATSRSSSGYKYPTAGAGRPENLKNEASFQRRFAGSVHHHQQQHAMPQVLADISTVPKELMLQVESLKSGVAYSALLKFPQPVRLTDISIPATGSMSSVSVDVWLDEGGEGGGARVAQSSEIKNRSMMLGNLSPPPICQYVKVWRCYIQ